MQDKKELILNKCRDLIYEAAFNMPYDKVNAIYTNYRIEKKIDDFLTDLIERGEFFYGDNFTKDFVNEKTDEARLWLLNDVMYGNGIDVETQKKEPVMSSNKEEKKEIIQEETKSDNNADKDTRDNIISGENGNSTENIDIEEPKEEITYEKLFDKLTKDYGWPEEAANKFILDKVKDENIKKQAEAALITKPLEPVTEDSLESDTTKASEIDEPMPVQTKEPKPGLIEKFKEKWKDPKFKRKVIIGGIVIAVAAASAIAIAISPELQQFLGGLVNNVTNFFTGDEVMHVTEATNVASGVDASAIDVNSLDTSSWNMEGFNVYDSASEAVNQMNPEAANQWFSSDIQGLYDTSTGQMLNLSPEDLQNADYIKDLLSSNENISAVFGDGGINTLNDVSGFVNGDDVVNLIEQGKVR